MTNKLTHYKFIIFLISCCSMFGCAHYTQENITERAFSSLNKSIQEQRWQNAFQHYTHIFITGTKNEASEALKLVKPYPQIEEAAYQNFRPNVLKQMVDSYNEIKPYVYTEGDAFCSLASAESCTQAFKNLKSAEQLIDPNKREQTWLSLVDGPFQKLSTKDKKFLEDNYHLRFYYDKDIGYITETQVQNISKAGNTAGSDIGSGLAGITYINNSISNNTYNVWTDLTVSILGGLAGSKANKAPVSRYIIQYSIRSLDNQIISTQVTKESPLSEPIGSCFSSAEQTAIDAKYCTMTPEDLRKIILSTPK